MKKQAEAWWLNKGQYYNQDKILYPKDAIMDAYMAGFDVGRIVGKSENEPADVADGDGRCRCPIANPLVCDYNDDKGGYSFDRHR